MNQAYLQSVYDKEEDQQAARLLAILIYAAWLGYLFVIFLGIYFADATLIVWTLIGCVAQILPLQLLRRGHLSASGLLLMVSLLGTLTIIATLGQGIRDLAILAFPVVFIFASMTLNRIIFGLCVGLTLATIGWLTFGEDQGWFVPLPYQGTPSWINFMIVAVILLISAFSVDLLATNMRKSLERARQEIAQRKRAEEQLRYQGTHDVLTGIYNRAFFETELKRFETSREFPISVIVADVDQLKLANDTQGHAQGDELLRHAAKVLRAVFRESDLLARIGGDEFAILLPATDSATVAEIVFRVREQLAEHNNQFPDLPLWLSLGAATAEKNNLAGACTLADQRMYADKTMRKSQKNLS